MHAIIESNKNILRSLQYHELKVKKGTGECLFAENFIKDTADLTLKDKLYPFQQRLSLNEAISKPVLHIILNFDPEEKITNDKMAKVAREYMQKMGWGSEPYIAYRHHDRPHPHLHLVAPKIQKDGQPLRIKREDFYRSRRETLQLEEEHNLKATDPETLRQYPLQKVRYGKTLLLPAMTKILETVIPVYLYTSMEELNVVLGLYNVRASRGRETSRTYKAGGLLYTSLGKDGRDVGKYLKASTFKIRPTLKNLEKRFIENRARREPLRRTMTTAIDWAFYKTTLSMDAFLLALKKEKISVVFNQDGKSNSQNVWYVDHDHKTVFDGNTLGDGYTARDISKRCVPEEIYEQQQQQRQTRRPGLDHY